MLQAAGGRAAAAGSSGGGQGGDRLPACGVQRDQRPAPSFDSAPQVIQLFDSWAHHLSPAQFVEFSLPYADRVSQALKAKYPHVPVILHANGGAALACVLLLGLWSEASPSVWVFSAGCLARQRRCQSHCVHLSTVLPRRCCCWGGGAEGGGVAASPVCSGCGEAICRLPQGWTPLNCRERDNGENHMLYPFPSSSVPFQRFKKKKFLQLGARSTWWWSCGRRWPTAPPHPPTIMVPTALTFLAPGSGKLETMRSTSADVIGLDWASDIAVARKVRGALSAQLGQPCLGLQKTP